MIIPDNVTVYMNGRAYYAHVCGFYCEGKRLSLSIDTSCLKDGGAEVNRVEPLNPVRREISINAEINGKSVTITYDPHDAEAVKAADVWRKALFAVKDENNVKFGEQQCRDYLTGAVERYLQNKQKHVDQAVAAMEPWTPDNRKTELEKASEPLRDYLKAHGDPHTSVIVTQYGVTEMQGERRVKFDSEKAAEAVKSGHWEKSDIPNEEYVCSECGGACWYYGYNGKLGKSRYCPNCGARMEDVT